MKKTSLFPNFILLVFGLVGLGMFGYSFAQQTMIQKQMNQTMAIVNSSIVSTGAVTKKTSQVLDPLYSTTQSLASIQQSEESTVTYLVSMNHHLENVGHTEQSIIDGLSQLNTISSDVSSRLRDLGATNNQLLSAGQTSLSQASQEANQLRILNQLTQNSIYQLQTLNNKLAPLRLLP